MKLLKGGLMVVGAATIATAAVSAGSFAIGGFVPEQYQRETYRGATVIYDGNGDVFILGEPKNMLQYLSQEDPHILRKSLHDFEQEVEE
tara:strand:+ start:327 stop:593 length:267 start_codon:yes stop_codon:yes gene_type:complete